VIQKFLLILNHSVHCHLINKKQQVLAKEVTPITKMVFPDITEKSMAEKIKSIPDSPGQVTNNTQSN
jgi:hypothetical protein